MSTAVLIYSRPATKIMDGDDLLPGSRAVTAARSFARALTGAARGAARGGAWLYLLAGTAGRLSAGRVRSLLRSRAAPPTPAEPPDPPPRRPRVLIVMPYAIVPTDHGAAVRVYNLIRLLARDCDLYLLVFSRDGEDLAQRVALEPYVEHLWFHTWRPDRPHRAPMGLLEPPSARLFYDSRAALQIRDIVAQHRIDVVQLELTELAQYRRAAGDVPAILVEHDVASHSFQRRRRLRLPQRFPVSQAYGATFRDWMALLRYEVAACREAQQVHVMSAADADYLARFLADPSPLRVVANGVDCEWYRPPSPGPARSGVLFAANFYTLPNLDAFEYFVGEVWPLVRQQREDAELAVVGAAMPPRLHEWHGRDGISMIGAVPDMRPAYHRHRLLVAPLRAGSGTRLKLLEAFAAGIAVVSTTIGAEGIECSDGEHLLIADDPAGIARAVGRLLDDDALAERLASNALRLAERYDWAISARAHLQGIHQLMSPCARQPVRPVPVGDPAPRPPGGADSDRIAVSVIIPCYRGGEMLARCLRAVSRQELDRPFEVLCLDSGSSAEELEVMRARGARVYTIDNRCFNHGLTRDLAAGLAAGEVLVFLNQDAVPAHDSWLRNLSDPLFGADSPGAVQGAMVNFPPEDSRVRPFFWDTCGPRFYFTREMRSWVGRYPGPSFSTVNAAMRRETWQRFPFGWAPFMEDKKWQRTALEAGLRIVAAPDATVYHSHHYTLRSLLRRCQSEGYGWSLLGQRYAMGDAVRDLWAPRLWLDLARALRQRRLRMSPAEVAYPWLRPLAVWYGNHYLEDVRH